MPGSRPASSTSSSSADIQGGAREFLLGCFRTQVEALLRLQHRDGGWHTLLDDPSSYVEASATAGFGYGLLKAARLGLLGDEARAAGLRALDCVIANIDRNGTVGNVSYGTRMGRDLQFYRDIPIQPTAYGQALAILFLAEAVRHTGRTAPGGRAMIDDVSYGAGPEDLGVYSTSGLRANFLDRRPLPVR